jgi:hypothetical protein
MLCLTCNEAHAGAGKRSEEVSTLGFGVEEIVNEGGCSDGLIAQLNQEGCATWECARCVLSLTLPGSTGLTETGASLKRSSTSADKVHAKSEIFQSRNRGETR